MRAPLAVTSALISVGLALESISDTCRPNDDRLVGFQDSLHAESPTLRIEIARVNRVPLVVKDLEFWHQARTPVKQERPLARMSDNEFGAQPVESAFEPHQYRIQHRARRHPAEVKLQRTTLRHGNHVFILAYLSGQSSTFCVLASTWRAKKPAGSQEFSDNVIGVSQTGTTPARRLRRFSLTPTSGRLAQTATVLAIR